MKEIKRDQSQHSRDEKKDDLTPEECSGLRIEDGVEVPVVCPEDCQKEQNQEREADGQERRRDEGELDFFIKEELENEVDEKTDGTDDQAVAKGREKSELSQG